MSEGGDPLPLMGEPARGLIERDAVLAPLPADARRRFTIYADLLARWQTTINLVSPATLPHLWTRHVADSLQVQAAAPAARRWVDLGSGGGFPGLVTAIILADEPGASVQLVESDKRKAAFLRTAARETGAPAIVHAERIEIFVPAHADPVDAVSARALAPLPKLVAFAQVFLARGALGVFPRGESAAAELTGWNLDHRFHVDTVPSRLRDGSCLLLVRTRALGGDPCPCPSPDR